MCLHLTLYQVPRTHSQRRWPLTLPWESWCSRQNSAPSESITTRISQCNERRGRTLVQVFIRSLRANSDQTSYSTVQISVSKFNIKCKVHRFFQRYRTVPHSITGRTPSELFFSLTIRTILDLIRRQIQKQVLSSQLCSVRNHDRTVCDRLFDENHEVFVRQYLGPRKWAGGQILHQSRPLSYDVKVGDQNYSRLRSQIWKNKTGHQDLSDTQQVQNLDI